MTKTLALVSLLLAAACIINTDDDGNNDTSGNTTANTQTTTATTAGTGDSTDATNASTTVGSSESTAADSSTAAAESSTGVANACGWGATGEKTTPMGYVCGGDGADPDMMIDMDCASYGVELVEGGDCGGNMGITGAGCCDDNGDVWYCADDAGMPRLFTESC